MLESWDMLTRGVLIGCQGSRIDSAELNFGYLSGLVFLGEKT